MAPGRFSHLPRSPEFAAYWGLVSMNSGRVFIPVFTILVWASIGILLFPLACGVWADEAFGNGAPSSRVLSGGEGGGRVPAGVLAAGAEGATGSRVMVLRVEGTITPGTARYLRTALREAIEGDYSALLVELDTPGGVVDPTLKIVSDFLEAPLPVITHVVPRGAIAASAGSFILLTGHLAAMAPGTTTGAAMPIQMAPGGEQRAADEKTISFLAGHIRSVARERGRPEGLAGEFVTENLTLDAELALEKGVVDLIAGSRRELLEAIHGREIQVEGEMRELRTSGASVTIRQMSASEQLEHFLGHPQVSFLLLIGGFYAVVIGLSMAGTYVIEAGGAIALLLGLYGLGMIEVNMMGILLVMLGVGSLILELFTPTFGLLTLVGVVLLVLGGMIFPGEPLLPGQWFGHFRMLVYGLAAASVLFFLVVLRGLMRIRGRVSGGGTAHDFTGIEARTVERLDPEGMVRLRGELWQARTGEGESIGSGEVVEVVGREGMRVIVRRRNEGDCQKEE